MAGDKQMRITRRSFLKGLGALALSALPACRRAQEYAVQPEDCPEWALPGESACFASAMPWAGGAYPLLAVCCDGAPIALQANPRYTVREGLPAHVQASLLDLYSPERPSQPTFGGRAVPWEGVRSSFRAWARAMRQGRHTAILLPEGYSAVRAAQMKELLALPHTHCYAYDPVAEPRSPLPEPLHRMQLAALGDAVAYDTPCGSLAELTKALPEIELLFIFTPADPAALNPAFAQALEQSPAETVRFTLRPMDETGRRCLYTIPQTHYLEEWGAEADTDGNLCLRQPVTLPLVPALAEAEALYALLHDGELPAEPRQAPGIVRDLLAEICPGLEDALRIGFIAGAAERPRLLPPAATPTPYLHPLFVDGRYLHNIWLREAYDPISGAAGAPAVYLPGQEFGATSAVRLGQHTLPAACIPGLAAPLLPLLPGAEGAPTPIPDTPFPTRPIHPLPPEPGAAPAAPPTGATQWGLVIDYTRCVGCNACTLACRAENNIPTVGSEEQRRGRDIQWLRLERYSEGQHLHMVPSACRQCQNAPCEAVCPVNATVHTSEGLNAMVYPRCWGTRYCAAACPYHARSFNYHDYAQSSRAATALPPNPQVTVRSRGVMEKCTCCVQRIEAARRSSAEPPRTACQQACPRGAIRLVNWSSEPTPGQLTGRFDTPGTHPSTVYTQSPPA